MSYYNWAEIMSKKPSNELVKIAKEHGKEPEEKINAALLELKKRGFDISDYSKILKAIKEKENEPKLDENSPTLYSDRVIYVFSILFSVIFGGILFSINLKELNNKKGIFPVITFSLLYTALSIYILNLINANSGGSLIFGAIGALIINKIFWNKYIGKETLYHKKSYKKPLIIALVIFVPLTALIIWANIITGVH